MKETPRTFDKRLLGTWKSDRRRTFANYKFGPKVPPTKIRKLKSLFGKFHVRWTRSRVAFWFEGAPKSYDKYEIVASDHQSVVVQTVSLIHGETELRYLLFEKDGYWIMGSLIPEFFRRVPDQPGR